MGAIDRLFRKAVYGSPCDEGKKKKLKISPHSPLRYSARDRIFSA